MFIRDKDWNWINLDFVVRARATPEGELALEASDGTELGIAEADIPIPSRGEVIVPASPGCKAILLLYRGRGRPEASEIEDFIMPVLAWKIYDGPNDAEPIIPIFHTSKFSMKLVDLCEYGLVKTDSGRYRDLEAAKEDFSGTSSTGI